MTPWLLNPDTTSSAFQHSSRMFSTRRPLHAAEGTPQVELLTSELGFQSLSPVFQTHRGRYSRSATRVEEAVNSSQQVSELENAQKEHAQPVEASKGNAENDHQGKLRTPEKSSEASENSRRDSHKNKDKPKLSSFRRVSVAQSTLSEPKIPFPWGKRGLQNTPSTSGQPSQCDMPIPEDEVLAPRMAEPASTLSARLTHVNSDGEAHMVDVGHKDSTTRVAIAAGHVRFSNPESLRLIVENSNKKGDVISTARIAGIMAAKRCSDLIPLCHPIVISKVSVKVRVHHPEESSPLLDSTEYGVVSVEAGVRCHGPTGVEMEALTAVMGACLTVYDMCKAVDKQMTIESGKLLFKEGGRSGTYIDAAFRDEHERRLTDKEKLV